MAEFDKNKVITVLDTLDMSLTDLIGKKFYFANDLLELESIYAQKRNDCKGVLGNIYLHTSNPFYRSADYLEVCYKFIYPVDEDKIRPLTEKEFIEWWKTSDCKIKSKGSGYYASVTSCHYEGSDSERRFYIDTDFDSFTLQEFCDNFVKLDGSNFEVEDE